MATFTGSRDSLLFRLPQQFGILCVVIRRDSEMLLRKLPSLLDRCEHTTKLDVYQALIPHHIATLCSGMRASLKFICRQCPGTEVQQTARQQRHFPTR